MKMEAFKQLWETMQSMDQTSDRVAYSAGVVTGLVGVTTGVVVGTKTAFDWVIDRYDEFETRTIERIIRKVEMNRRSESKET